MGVESWPGLTIDRYPAGTEEEQAICVYHKLGNPDEAGWFLAISVEEGISEEDFRDFMTTIFKKRFLDTLLDACFSLLCLRGPENHYSIFQEVFSDLTDKRFVGWGKYDLYNPPTQLPTRNLPLPPGYSFGEIAETHVGFLARQWLKDVGATPSSLAHEEKYKGLIRDNITQRPSVAIFSEQEKGPVAWMTTYQDGYGGQLHVVEAHRGGGLARLCLRELFNKTRSLTGTGYPVSIGQRNEASAALFTSEGWTKADITRKHYLKLSDG